MDKGLSKQQRALIDALTKEKEDKGYSSIIYGLGIDIDFSPLTQNQIGRFVHDITDLLEVYNPALTKDIDLLLRLKEALTSCLIVKFNYRDFKGKRRLN